MEIPTDVPGMAADGTHEGGVTHNVFVARQPILDRAKKVYGYELLFRSGFENACGIVDGNDAARTVVHAAWIDLGLGYLVGEARAFVNVTQELLISGLVSTLPSESTVIEILETVEPDDELMRACHQLKQLGYLLALDDFVYRPGLERLLKIADIVKIRLGECDAEEQCQHVRQHASKSVTLLAEKVETKDDYDRAIALGCRLFQGWFFCHPEIVVGRALTGSRLTYLKLIQAVSGPEYNPDTLVDVIHGDVSIAHRLLKYLGSAAFPWRKEVNSVRHALMLLGESGTRKWVSLTALDKLAEAKPRELLVNAAVRASFCEGLAEAVGLSKQKADLFLLGAFSLIDTMLDQPMSEVLAQLPLNTDLKNALEGRPGGLRPVLDLVEAYQRGDWKTLPALCEQLKIEESLVVPSYRSAVVWSTKMMAA